MATKLDTEPPTMPIHEPHRWSARPRRWLQRTIRDSLLRNSFFIMATTVATSGLGYIYWTVAARVFPPAAVGLASALLSVAVLVSTLSNLGLPAAVIEVLPTRRSTRAWSAAVDAALLLVTLTGLVFGCGLWLLLPRLSPNLLAAGAGPEFAALVIGLVTLWNIAMTVDGVFLAERTSHFMFSRNVVFAALKIPLLLLPLFLPLLSRNASTIVLSWALATAFSLMLALLWYIPRLGHRHVSEASEMGKQARLLGARVAGNHLINLGGLLPMYLLPVIVTTRLSATDNAYFYTTWMVGGIFFMISSSISTALFAEGSAERRDLATRARTSALLIAAALIPVGGVFLFWGRYILEVFGSNYAAHSVALLTILVCSAVPDAITNVAVSVLRVRRHTYVAGALNLGMSVLALTLAWFLLPGMGVVGAGWAWLIGQSCGSAVVILIALANRGRHSKVAAEVH